MANDGAFSAFSRPRGSTALTLLELIVVIVIIGILATLGISQFYGPREQAIKQEALANLKLMSSAEKIYRMENSASQYILCTSAADCNGKLNLAMPADNKNWAYKVDVVGGNTFTAKSQRTKDNTIVFCINQVQDDVQVTGCTW